MRFRAALVMLIASMGLASCGGDAQPGTNPPAAGVSPSSSAVQSNGGRRIAENVNTKSVPRPRDSNAVSGTDIPAGAQFMIFCDVVRGPLHVEDALRLKQELSRQYPDLRDWHVIHSADESSLYYGYYQTIEDVDHYPQEVARAMNDRKKIETLPDALNERRFKNSIFVPVNSPNPEAPREWDLANTGPDAFWSLQVGAYHGSPERKRAAVESVREMRAHNIEAYYFHGDTVSSVCIGTWPRSAIKEQARDNARTDDPSQPLLVLSDKAPIGINPELYDKDTGKRMLIIAPRLEIMDDSLKAAMAKYPYNAVNGMEHTKGGVTDPSLLVEIIHNQDATYTSAGKLSPEQVMRDSVTTGANDAARAILEQQPSPTSQQQPARLRSIGDR